jgi:ABC-type transport system involved in multi-copper enzyme maturation permease subunit
MMARAVHAEWTKLRTVPSTAWLSLALIAFTVAVGVAVTVTQNTSFCSPEGCDQDITKLSLSGVYLGQAAVVVLAVLAVTNEYASGMIRTTLAANSRRTTVFAARAAVVSAVVLGGGLLGVLGSLAVARVILPGHGFTATHGYPPLSLADEPTLRAAAGTVLYLGLVALLSLGVGTVVRDTAGAITAVLALLYVFPIFMTFVNDPHWRERIEKLSPMTAGLAIQATRGLDGLPIGPWAGLGVLAAYAGTALLFGAVLFKIRDA